MYKFPQNNPYSYNIIAQFEKDSYFRQQREKKLVISDPLSSGVKNTPKIAIFRMCYGENGTVKFLENLADNIFSHRYSMMQI
jgi:hypothetical protein